MKCFSAQPVADQDKDRLLRPAGGGPGKKNYAYYADGWAQQPKLGAAIALANQIPSFKQESMRSLVLSTKRFFLDNNILVIGLVTLVDLICH